MDLCMLLIIILFMDHLYLAIIIPFISTVLKCTCIYMYKCTCILLIIIYIHVCTFTCTVQQICMGIVYCMACMPGNVCTGKTSLIIRNKPVRENITREIPYAEDVAEGFTTQFVKF